MNWMRIVSVLLLISGNCYAQNATTSANITLVWDSNVEKDLAGYKLYQSDTGTGGPFDQCIEDNIPPSGNPAVTYPTVVTIETGQTLCFAVTAFNTGGAESAKSNVLCYSDRTCIPLPAQTKTQSCPAGQTGSITQTRTSTCPGPVWGPWTTTSNTCKSATCTPHTETRTAGCTYWWYKGSTTQQRTSTCQNGQEVWGSWKTTSSTCKPWWQR